MYVGATPSEYLVCTRRGQVDAKRSGQGRRIIKWPWLSVAVIPTTLQRIDFTADQITRERIGVSVTGIAVFRIAEPLLAFRVLNFDDGLATEKLAATMRDMFIGAARRLIANLSLEDCLTRRKEAIAGYLVDEIAPVVSGEGSPHDSTTTGWGVVIDTIEIQQVRIQSQQVFAHLQAPYRAEIAARAELADVARERQLADERAKIALRQIELAEAHRRAHAAAEIAALEVERGRIEATHLQTTLQLEQERQLELTRAEMKRRQAEEKDFESQLAAAHQRRLTEIENLNQHRARRPEHYSATLCDAWCTESLVGGCATRSPFLSDLCGFVALWSITLGSRISVGTLCRARGDLDAEAAGEREQLRNCRRHRVERPTGTGPDLRVVDGSIRLRQRLGFVDLSFRSRWLRGSVVDHRAHA